MPCCFECERCKYSTQKLFNFKRHLDRKNTCKPINKDIDIDTMKANLDISLQNKYVEKIHNLENKVSDLQKELEKTKLELDKYKKKATEDAHLKNFGNEYICDIDPKFLKSCALTYSNGFIKLAEKIFIETKCNNNIKYHSIRNKQVKIFQNGEWKISDEHHSFSKMIEICQRILLLEYVNKVKVNYHDTIELENDHATYKYLVNMNNPGVNNRHLRKLLRAMLLAQRMNQKI